MATVLPILKSFLGQCKETVSRGGGEVGDTTATVGTEEKAMVGSFSLSCKTTVVSAEWEGCSRDVSTSTVRCLVVARRGRHCIVFEWVERQVLYSRCSGLRDARTN